MRGGRLENPLSFPAGFLWGAATSAYQVEGSPLADGAGESIWHVFSHTPDKIRDGMTGDVACDHYHRWAGDIGQMRALGLAAYRFSVAWGRVFPEGTGRVNEAGLAFYDRLVDGLLEAGITPMLTLFHWDLPQALEDRGGWRHPDMPRWFGDYAWYLFEHFGDRVPLWCTINEPWVVVDAGYVHGVNAPGVRDWPMATRVAHGLLRAHAAAVRRFRDARLHDARIGLVVNLAPHHPSTDSPADVAAAARGHAYFNEQFLDPVFFGRYPELVREMYGDAWPSHPESELRELMEPIDFLGVNWYTGYDVRDDPSRGPARCVEVPVTNEPRMTTGWEVRPELLVETLTWVTQRYGRIPLYVTENGAAFPDPDHASGGRVDDPLRVDYLRRHIAAMREAMRRGVDLRGYFVWSLMDNFEWASGYSHRMGLLHVDYTTQQRTVKASGEFYARVIRENGVNVADSLDPSAASLAARPGGVQR
jgi:beta-glucosidase